ncbi:ribose-phosphate pyrophosphokinase [Candidatus Riesia pediculischaeffi]|uniref:Ribose-phosphate pyrophosphokinase n=1 Tax=Candidatus Riesia pediculischaeffi PTSU TaxID=1401651 RepID=A0A0C1S0S2_9ENTR|nr:ribose-phosphate pyrophosphokinase [Candidatus Riesia pediculischaeffi]KIE64162.1 Ribose-phosphate pyrophosphokinase [Candidatus Riesia pediculischaeffi PTSU]
MNIKIFSGNSVIKLSKNISKHLHTNLGDASVGKFSDGEINVQINESVRGKDVFIIQSTCYPANDHLMELILMIDALYRASSKRITAVIPYFGYARQDRRVGSSKTPITAKIVANILSCVGTSKILTVDLHTDQIQGFFDIPIENISGNDVILKDIESKKLYDPIIVSPDIGGIFRARMVSKLLNNMEIAIIDKIRSRANVSEMVHIIGNVKNRDCIIIDDIVDTGSTLCQAAEILKKNGAYKIFIYVTHPVFSGNSLKNITKSSIDEMVVCDTIPVSEKINGLGKIRSLTLSFMLAESIKKINNEASYCSIKTFNK